MLPWFSRFFIVLALLFGGAALPAVAEEFIRSYHSDIDVATDGGLTVRETIIVNAEGQNIRRGIFRDFPLTMKDADSRTQRVGFDVVSVMRDGGEEPWRTESVTGGIRIYAGSADVTLDDGEHTYVFTYRTDRQIRYFADHDELYWNVNGNGWQFRIANASARITLPGGATVNRTAAFTGPIGSTASNARMQPTGNGAVFATTRPLGPQEGLTIVAGFPKGVVAAPSDAQARDWWLRDNAANIIGFGGLVLIALYYTWAWRSVGRDPEGGVVVPRWDVPEGLSPALVNYIDNRGFSGGGWTAFSASALDLAVKGYVVLEDLRNSITIRRSEAASASHSAVPSVGASGLRRRRRGPDASIPAGQATILKAVDAGSGELVIDKDNGEAVEKAGSAFRQAIESEHRGKYYRANWLYVVSGFALSIATIIAVIAFGNLEPDMIAMLIVPTLVSAFFGFFAVGFGRKLRRGSSLFSRIMAVIVLGFIGMIALSILSTVIVAMAETLTGSEHFAIFVAVGGIVLINVLFFFLMGAPTPLGATLVAAIEGLRIYLTLAEKDRMNMAGAPTMSPQHFETLLPYAVALGVEKPWSSTFETWLAAATAAGVSGYAASWYIGNTRGSFGDRIGGFSSGMASTIASTIPAPVSSSSSSSSSSGFSGGSSGGGGGGGGGGGW